MWWEQHDERNNDRKAMHMGKGGIWSFSNQPGGMGGEWKQEK